MPRHISTIGTIPTDEPVGPGRTLAPCFRCRHFDRITPATHIVFYDESVGSFAEREEPRLCQGHVDELRDLGRDHKKEFFRGFPIRPPEPEVVEETKPD